MNWFLNTARKGRGFIAISVMLTAICIAGSFAGCSNDDNIYDFENLYSYKGTSIDDLDKVKELIGYLQYEKELQLDCIEIADSEQPYLRINYKLEIPKGGEYTVNHRKLMQDAVILFALMDELPAVEYNLENEEFSYGYGGVPTTREEAEKVLGESIKELGVDKNTFLSEMPGKIMSLSCNPDVMSVIPYDHMAGIDE